MYKVLLFLLFPIIIACGELQKRELAIEGFEEYITLFETEAQHQGLPLEIDNLIVNYGDLSQRRINDKPVIGLCTRELHKTPVITIDIGYWDKATEEAREWLMFHELGHCVINRPHRDDRLKQTNCVASIMNSVAEYYCYYNLRDYYIKELFTLP